jgi:hypothetical protein
VLTEGGAEEEGGRLALEYSLAKTTAIEELTIMVEELKIMVKDRK